MQVIQILAIIFALFAASRVYLRFKERLTDWKEFTFWTLVWVLAIIIAIFPNLTFYLSRALGIERGIDVVIYLSIIVLFYLVFRLYAKIDNVEQDMTKIVRKLSMIDVRKKK